VAAKTANVATATSMSESGTHRRASKRYRRGQRNQDLPGHFSFDHVVLPLHFGRALTRQGDRFKQLSSNVLNAKGLRLGGLGHACPFFFDIASIGEMCRRFFFSKNRGYELGGLLFSKFGGGL
jgi:hypothetical protein